MVEARRRSRRDVGARIVIGVALALALAGGAHAGDGVQFARDCTRTYVNKQVGDTEQWAITWEIYGNATGNVLKLDGGTPSFIECALVGEDADDEIFDCYGSDACAGPTCGRPQWSLIGSSISIPLTFFFPPGVDPLNPFEECEPSS